MVVAVLVGDDDFHKKILKRKDVSIYCVHTLSIPNSPLFGTFEFDGVLLSPVSIKNFLGSSSLAALLCFNFIPKDS